MSDPSDNITSRDGSPESRTLRPDFLFDPLALEEEDLFARNIDGQLVRLEESTADDFSTDVTLKIDGEEITVKKAVPATDAQGNILNGPDGAAIPRNTTIYDAASKLFAGKPDGENPIPVLCHREHLKPAGVCRVCVVELYRTMGGKRRGSGTLVPACHHRVEEGMEVQTIASPNDPAAGQRVRSSVKVLTELLVADHLPDEDSAGASNELLALARRMGVDKSRFAQRPPSRGLDESSPRIAVNHDLCILCDRCVRACSDVKQNYVIGRSGKGYDAQIAFDLDAPMGESSCVSCGECMISCPTDALTFREQVRVETPLATGQFAVTAEELMAEPMFAGVPYRFLEWNVGSVVRQRLQPGEVLCREGEYGREAFLLLKGEFEVTNPSIPGHGAKEASKGTWGWFGRLRNRLTEQSDGANPKIGGGALYAGRETIRIGPEDLIIGEMTCMSHYPRSATVTAATEAEVLRINRNVLYMLQRNETARKTLDAVYRKRALSNQLSEISILSALSDEERAECVAYLRDVVELVHVDPGQEIFRQGEKADDVYTVRLGFVKVTQDRGGQAAVLSYLGPGRHFGEIGVLSGLGDELGSDLPGTMIGRRSATCTALDDVELVRIRGEHFRELWRRYPGIQEPFIRYAKDLLAREKETRAVATQPLPEFLDQGLFNAQNLLVLDLEACTRCDECTKACSDTHEGITRLIREGLRFDKWLVAGSCRSCLDPYCLVGCPVDAIHREGSMEIRIEDHCIGCGLCAQNCPYGNINMHGFATTTTPKPGARAVPIIQQKATTCDLCRDVVPKGQDPSCVYACPHNAAFRMSGPELLGQLEQNDLDASGGG